MFKNPTFLIKKNREHQAWTKAFVVRAVILSTLLCGVYVLPYRKSLSFDNEELNFFAENAKIHNDLKEINKSLKELIAFAKGKLSAPCKEIGRMNNSPPSQNSNM